MSKRIVIIGGGITGLTAGWKLSEAGASVVVLERKGEVGGISGSFKRGDCTLDYGPHKVYTQIPGVLEEFRELLREDFIAIPKSQKLLVRGRYYAFPVKVQQLLTGMSPVLAARCGVAYAVAIGRRVVAPLPDVNYENFLLNRFGTVVYKLLFEPYAWKVWGDPKLLSSDLAKARVSVPSLGELLKRVVMGDGDNRELSAKTFYYPRKGFGEVCDKLAERIRSHGGEVLTSCTATRIVVSDGGVSQVEYSTGGVAKRVDASFVLSTVPVNELPGMIFPLPPSTVLDAASRLKWRSVILVYIVAAKDRLFQENWLFFPEREFCFNRVSEQKGFNPELVPAGKTVLCCEITCDFLDANWRAADAELFERVTVDLEKARILSRGDVVTRECFTVKLKDPYPLYSLDYSQNLSKVLGYSDSIKGLMTLGRLGLFNYNNTDHCVDMARKAADHILSNRSVEEWKAQREVFKKYVIVD
ncbi:MAG: FAD-dependent oxidoreductase [Candidatus Micrarchaeota archaeon]